jgi:glycosyltransferase involved in cell wall biosynthesis
MFVITSMPVGGAEMLLVNLVRRFDPARIAPQICCLKDKDRLGEIISSECRVHSQLIKHKFDIAVVRRLRNLFREQQVNAVITVGAGDKMFWGRLAARAAGVPVILSALHSTGWPDGVGRLNRLLTPITSGFIAVADSHGKYMVDSEKFPADKVFVIRNGIDTKRFQFDERARSEWRKQLGISLTAPVVGIVAALRPEKNHHFFLRCAAEILQKRGDARFVIAGSGQEEQQIRSAAVNLGIDRTVHMIGSTDDVPGVLSMVDLFALTSHNEANPVSILEAMSCRRPVVAPDVGSIRESVIEGVTGFVVTKNDIAQMAHRWLELLNDPSRAAEMGAAARSHIMRHGSLEAMTEGYTLLVENLYHCHPERKSGREWRRERDRGIQSDPHRQVPCSTRERGRV